MYEELDCAMDGQVAACGQRGNVHNYTGSKSTTRNNLPCLRWDELDPPYSYGTERWPHNHCRHLIETHVWPRHGVAGPWCLAKDPHSTTTRLISYCFNPCMPLER